MCYVRRRHRSQSFAANRTMNRSSLLAFVAVVVLASCCGCGPQPAAGAKVLALFVFPGKSHSIMLNRVLEGLLANGHEVTALNNYPLPAGTPNYTNVDISPEFDFWKVVKDTFNIPTIFDMHNLPMSATTQMLDIISIHTTEHVLKHPNVQRIMHTPPSEQPKYDVVLVEQFHQEAFLLLAHQFGAPVVSIASFEYAQQFNEMMGAFGAWSYVAHDYLPLDPSMTFAERALNTWVSLGDWWERRTLIMPNQQRLADKYFGYLPEPRPTLEQLNRNLSLLLLNAHTPLNKVRPSAPGIVDVGGLHISADVRPLPADLQRFCDEATDGVIYFSLGTQLRSADMPAAQLAAFRRIFERWPRVRVVWKWEDEALAAQLPKNVMVKRWLPQNDVLAHRNVRLFITHGGLLGTQEGVHHAVPMLGIPVYADQHLNMAKAQRAGYAISLSFDNVTDASLAWAFDELLSNPRYTDEVRRMSAIFRDRPEHPLQRAVYWIEYVIRHRGAPHLRSPALDLPFWQLYLLDLAAAVLVAFVAVLAVVWWAVKRVRNAIACVCKCSGKKAAKSGKKKL